MQSEFHQKEGRDSAPDAMIQRATAAIIAELQSQAERSGCSTEHHDGIAQVEGSFDVVALARAAIAAMREPTAPMRRAAELAAGDMFTGVESAAYIAMIDAALAEE